MDGTGVITLARKPVWPLPLPVSVDPVVLGSLGSRSSGMHRSPVTPKRDEWSSKPPALCIAVDSFVVYQCNSRLN